MAVRPTPHGVGLVQTDARETSLTRISLGRFLNRRRVAAALAALKDESRPLAQVAVDLGFSSQSHFTRVFSSLTGMTPAKYGKLFKPAIG